MELIKTAGLDKIKQTWETLQVEAMIKICILWFPLRVSTDLEPLAPSCRLRLSVLTSWAIKRFESGDLRDLQGIYDLSNHVHVESRLMDKDLYWIHLGEFTMNDMTHVCFFMYYMCSQICVWLLPGTSWLPTCVWCLLKCYFASVSW